MSTHRATALRVTTRDRLAPRAPAEGRRQRRAIRRRAQHDPAVRAYHRRLRTGLWRYISRGNVATLATAPVIYSMIVPFVILDAWVSIYQAICFRAGVRSDMRGAFGSRTAGTTASSPTEIPTSIARTYRRFAPR